MVTGKAFELEKVVVLDTNMLLASVQFGVDVYGDIRVLFPGFKIVTLDLCLNELVKISRQSVKKGLMVKFSKDLMVKEGIGVYSASGYADDALIEAGKKGAVIATNDKVLKKRLKKEGVKVIYLRQKKFLETE